MVLAVQWTIYYSAIKRNEVLINAAAWITVQLLC